MTYTIGDLLISQTVKTDSTVSSELEYVQGDIWIANLENKALGHEQGGNRPVLIISDTTWNRKSKTPICVICTTSEKKGRNRYCVKIRANPKLSFANGSQLYTLDNSRLINRVGKTSKSKLLLISVTLKPLVPLALFEPFIKVFS